MSPAFLMNMDVSFQGNYPRCAASMWAGVETNVWFYQIIWPRALESLILRWPNSVIKPVGKPKYLILTINHADVFF